jgi:hypothetical protein
LSEVGRTSCEICIQQMGIRDMDTPCETCRPELKKFNEPYFALFNYCQDQVIMGYSGPVALDGNFINTAMNDHHIDQDERVEFSLAVRKIGRTIFNARAEEAAEELERERNKK